MRERAVMSMWAQHAASLCAIGMLALAGIAQAAPNPIYTCVDANGRKHTSDRLIPECALRDQRVLNPDGSVRRLVPPALTAEERAAQETREREAAAEQAAHQDAVRRDRSLAIRFPNEAAHNKARNAALDDVRKSVQLSEKRLAELAAERKPLQDEAEFYKGRTLPAKLKQSMDANDASTEAQRSLIQNQESEIVRINGLFDAELTRLRRLWSGAPPGSLGAPVVAAAAAASAPVPRKAASK